MALEIPQYIRQRLAAVIDDLKNAVGQEAAKAYLTRITAVESLELEPGAELRDNSWMEYNDNEIDAGDPSCPTPFSPSGKIEPLLQTTNSQTGADPRSPASSPQIANAVSPKEDTLPALSDSCRGPRKNSKKPTSGYNTLDTVAQGLPRSDLLDCLRIYWDTLKVEGIFTMPSRQVFTWTMEGSSDQVRRLHHHLILRHLDVEDDLHQWRRSIAEIRNLDGYTSFFTEAQTKQRIHKQTRHRGESNSNKAQKEYLAHIYADRTPQNYERVKQALRKDLRHGRRWSILVNGFVAENGDSISGLGLGLLLLCGPGVARKMSHTQLTHENLLTCITVTTLQDTLILI